jgi:hypothetical protein
VEEVIIIININRFGSLVYLDPLAARCLLPVGIAIKIRERIRCKSDLEFLPAVALPSHISGVSDHTHSRRWHPSAHSDQPASHIPRSKNLN